MRTILSTVYDSIWSPAPVVSGVSPNNSISPLTVELVCVVLIVALIAALVWTISAKKSATRRCFSRVMRAHAKSADKNALKKFSEVERLVSRHSILPSKIGLENLGEFKDLSHDLFRNYYRECKNKRARLWGALVSGSMLDVNDLYKCEIELEFLEAEEEAFCKRYCPERKPLCLDKPLLA